MFRLNRLTDYAVVVMTQLATRGDQTTLSAQQLSRGTAVPLPTVSKVLTLLAKGGLITSHRGASGGYALTRPAVEISVAAIIEAIEGPIALTACVDGSADSCGVESLCPMRGTWDRVNHAIQSALDEVTLQEMTASFFDFPAVSPVSAPITSSAGKSSGRAD